MQTSVLSGVSRRVCRYAGFKAVLVDAVRRAAAWWTRPDMTVLAIGLGCGCAICATVSSRLPVFRVVTPDRLLTSDNDFENRAPSLCERRRVGIHNARTKTNTHPRQTWSIQMLPYLFLFLSLSHIELINNFIYPFIYLHIYSVQQL